MIAVVVGMVLVSAVALGVGLGVGLGSSSDDDDTNPNAISTRITFTTDLTSVSDVDQEATKTNIASTIDGVSKEHVSLSLSLGWSS